MKKKRFIKVFLCFAAGSCLSFIARADTQTLDGVAAYVNEHVITGGDVAELAQPVVQQIVNSGKAEERPARLKKAYEDALNSLVERHLILDAYGKQEQKLPEWTIDARVNEIIHDSFNDDRGDLMTALSKGKVTFEEWKSQVKDHIIVSAMRGDRIERHTRVSPQAVRAAYDKNRDQYRTSDQVRLRMIVLKKGTSADGAAEKRKQADDIRKRLQAGEDFASLAKTVSADGKAESGGDWGWMEPRKLRPELAKPLVELKPSEISGVIETKEELYILKVEERRLGAVPSFEEVQSKIERDLRQEEARILYDAWIEALKKTAYVKTFDIGPYVEHFLR